MVVGEDADLEPGIIKMQVSQAEQDAANLVRSLRDKLIRAAAKGPDGDDVVLSPEEATVAYRLLFGDASQG